MQKNILFLSFTFKLVSYFCLEEKLYSPEFHHLKSQSLTTKQISFVFSPQSKINTNVIVG